MVFYKESKYRGLFFEIKEEKSNSNGILLLDFKMRELARLFCEEEFIQKCVKIRVKCTIFDDFLKHLPHHLFYNLWLAAR